MKTALRVYFTNCTLSLNGPGWNHKQIWHGHKKLLTPNELREETHTKNNRYFRGRTTKVRVPPPPKDLSGSNLADISHYIKSCSVSVNARDPPLHWLNWNGRRLIGGRGYEGGSGKNITERATGYFMNILFLCIFVWCLIILGEPVTHSSIGEVSSTPVTNGAPGLYDLWLYRLLDW